MGTKRITGERANAKLCSAVKDYWTTVSVTMQGDCILKRKKGRKNISFDLEVR
jgi:hypothetical protein